MELSSRARNRHVGAPRAGCFGFRDTGEVGVRYSGLLRLLHERDGRLRRRPWNGLWAGLVLAALATTGCGSDGGNADAGPHDYVIPDLTLGDVPEACAHGTANEKGVGAPCTMGGGECKRFGTSVCACDPLLGYMLQGAPCICTIPIFGMTCDQIPSDYCGSNATCCSYPMLGSACFPNACLDMAMCPMDPVTM